MRPCCANDSSSTMPPRRPRPHEVDRGTAGGSEKWKWWSWGECNSSRQSPVVSHQSRVPVLSFPGEANMMMRMRRGRMVGCLISVAGWRATDGDARGAECPGGAAAPAAGRGNQNALNRHPEEIPLWDGARRARSARRTPTARR